MWKTTTDPVARPAIRNLKWQCFEMPTSNNSWINSFVFFCQRWLFLQISLLLVVRESETSDAGVAGGESVEESQIESAPHLSWSFHISHFCLLFFSSSFLSFFARLSHRSFYISTTTTFSLHFHNSYIFFAFHFFDDHLDNALVSSGHHVLAVSRDQHALQVKRQFIKNCDLLQFIIC